MFNEANGRDLVRGWRIARNALPVLIGALWLQGCEWFTGSETQQDRNPFAGEAPEILTAHVPRVALDGNGFATVVYQDQASRGSEQRTRVRAIRHDLASATTSDSGVLLDRAVDAASYDTAAALVSDQSGAVEAYFTRPEGTRCRLVPGQAWACEARSAETIALAMDGTGRATAIGPAPGARNGQFVGRHFSPASGWSAEHTLSMDRIESSSGTEGHDERDTLAYWSGGVGFAVWTDSSFNVRASRFLRDTNTWTESEVLGVIRGDSTGPKVTPHVALARNAPGAGAVAVWIGADLSIQHASYIPGAGWQAAQSFVATQGLPGRLENIDVAMSGNGDAFVMGFGAGREVRVIRRANGVWQTPQVVGLRDAVPDSSLDATSQPRIVADGAGGALAVWLAYPSTVTETGRILANRYIPGAGWQGVWQLAATAKAVNFFDSGIGTAVSSAGVSDASAFDVDMDAAGRVMIAWIGSAGDSAPPGSSRLRTWVSGLFGLSATPAAQAMARNGDSKVIDVVVTRPAYTGSVGLQVLGCPARVICSLGTTQLQSGQTATTLTFITSSAEPATPGSYSVRVEASGGAQTSEAAIALTITGTEPPPPASTVTLNVSGPGRVVSSPAGLDCLGPQLCTGQFARNQVVTLTATPGAGQAFAGYGGDPDCSDGVLTLTANAACAATFIPLQGQWSADGAALNISPLTTAANIESPEIEVNQDGSPVAAFVENEKVMVRRWDGSTWRLVGEPLGVVSVGASSLTLDSSGAPVVAWDEYDAANNGSRNVYAARWNGSAWTMLGAGAVDLTLAADARAPSIRARSGDIALAWSESTAVGGSHIVVRIWNGTTWSNAGSTSGPPQGVALSDSDTPRLAVGPADALAVAWSEGLRLEVAELVSGNWVRTPVPMIAATSGGPCMLDISFSAAEGLVFVAAQNNGGPFTVRRWRGGSWSDLGTVRGIEGMATARIFGLALSHGRTGSTPLLAFSRRNQAGSVSEFIVERYSGTDWARVGGAIQPTTRHGSGGLEFAVAIADAPQPRLATQVIGSLPTGARDDSVIVYRFR